MNEQTTEKAKHTPGPWVFAYGSVYQGDDANTVEEHIGRIAHADRDNPRTTPTERDANARLIAAAPELLAALELVWNKVLTEYHSPDSPIREQVEKAIASATGESEGHK